MVYLSDLCLHPIFLLREGRQLAGHLSISTQYHAGIQVFAEISYFYILKPLSHNTDIGNVDRSRVLHYEVRRL